MLTITLKDKTTGGVKYTVAMHPKGSAAGSVALVALADHGIVVNFANSGEMNKFIKAGGNEKYSIHKMLADRKYYTWAVYLCDCGGGKFVAKAYIQESYDGPAVDEFIGPVAFSYDAAAKSFWTAWNKGDHRFKKDDGSAATLVRIAKQPYLYGEPPIPAGWGE